MAGLLIGLIELYDKGNGNINLFPFLKSWRKLPLPVYTQK